VKKLIYFDHNATTPVSTKVLTRLSEAVALWGNPSSIHWAGQQAKALLRGARQNVAKALGVSPLEIIFTAGGSESNNTVIKGVFQRLKNSERNEYITSAVEHPSVLNTFRWIESQGAVVHFLKVDLNGHIDLETYKKLLGPKTALVSVMAANNETGVLFPVAEMAALAHQAKALFHTDGVQMFGKLPMDLKQWDVDFASISAHKFYSLKGVGVLYAKKGSEVLPLIHGGGQERHRRGGTENTLGIFSLGVMAQEISQVSQKAKAVAELRDELERRVLAEIPHVQITHGKAPRLPNTSSFVLDGVDGETLLMSMDVKGFAVSTGAACSSGSPEPSPVLLAIGLNREQAQSSLRVSLGWESTSEEVDEFVHTLKGVVEHLRDLQGGIPRQRKVSSVNAVKEQP
jgi:cysteine desulfurase